MVAVMRPLILTTSLLMVSFISCAPNAPDERPVNRSTSTAQQSNKECIKINTATLEELMRLPGVGEVMSRKIIEHRELHGPFRRPQDLIIIEGFSENKYRAIASLVCVE